MSCKFKPNCLYSDPETIFNKLKDLDRKFTNKQSKSDMKDLK